MPLDAAPDADAALDDASLDAGVDAGPLECAAEPGDGVALVAAEFPSTGAVDVPLDMLCDTLAGVICDALAACSCDATHVARCREFGAAQCANDIGLAAARTDVASGAVLYDAGAAGRVVAMVRAGLATCQTPYLYFSTVLVAAGVFRGSLPAGERCDHEYVCADGLACRNIGDLILECRPIGFSGCAALGLCQPRPGDASSLACAGDRCDHGLPPGAYQPPGNFHCRWAQRADGICGCEPVVGAPCTGPGECGSGYCASGACAARVKILGDSCTTDECDAAACIGGVCAPYICNSAF